MTRGQTLGLGYGDWLYHRTKRQAGGREPLRVRVSGSVRTWKRDPTRIEVPTKWGLRGHHVITERELPDWYATPEEVERFRATSAAVQAEYGLVPDAAEAAQLVAEQKQIQELRDLFVYALQNAMQESAEMATHGLLRLGARNTVEDLLDRYNRNLPPFRGAKGRWKKGSL